MRVYDKEFKEEAIKLSYEIGNKVASKQLGITVTTLYTWRSRHNQYGSIAFVGSGRKRMDPKTAEIRAMKKKIKELETVNDIFKKALAFFRREPKEVAAGELFQWIWMHKTQDKARYSIKNMCKVLNISN
jgi:transposase